MKSALKALPVQMLLWLLRGYQIAISPMFGPRCRFYPTCSNYAMDAIREHGALKGAMLAAVRLAKCHPWHPGGFDPVEKKAGRQDTPPACECGHH
jgi:putative membrane protein insertion efficiency factor